MKSVSRNKFLLCFRPVVDMDLMIEPKDGINRTRKSRSLNYITPENSENSTMVRRRSSSSNRSFSKGKKNGDRKNLSQNSHDIQQTNQVLCSQSSFGSSSSSSSTSTTSISEPPHKQNLNDQDQERVVKKTKKDHHMVGSWSSNSGIILLLISIVVTILWGRFFAILITSIWLYFLPQQQQQHSNCGPENVKKLTEKSECSSSSRVYKKRIIMEGLLERNHHR